MIAAQRQTLCLLVGFALAATASAHAGDGRGSVQAACFAAGDLRARAGEQTPVKLGHAQPMREPEWKPSGELAMNMVHGVVRRVDLPPGRKLVALTFDLCETWGEIAGYDGGVVDYLRANKIKATFFGGGKWMVNHGVRTQQLMSDDLFEVGTHGWAHRNMRGLKGLEMLRELTGPTAAYRQERATLAARQCAAGQDKAMSSIPVKPALYRFPFGACNPAALDAVAQSGLVAIEWDVSTGDPAPSQSARAIVQDTLRHVRPGSIVLSHANGRGYHTAEALPMLIPELKKRGYEFVTVSELLAAGKPEIVQTCYDEKPGDTDKYDAWFAPRSKMKSWGGGTEAVGAK